MDPKSAEVVRAEQFLNMAVQPAGEFLVSMAVEAAEVAHVKGLDELEELPSDFSAGLTWELPGGEDEPFDDDDEDAFPVEEHPAAAYSSLLQLPLVV